MIFLKSILKLIANIPLDLNQVHCIRFFNNVSMQMKKFIFKVLFVILIVSSSSTQKINAFIAGSETFEGVRDYAKSVTLGIETPASSSSGVIIGKKGDI